MFDAVARDFAHAAVVVVGLAVLLGSDAEHLPGPRGRLGDLALGEPVTHCACLVFDVRDLTVEAVAFVAHGAGGAELALDAAGLLVERVELLVG